MADGPRDIPVVLMRGGTSKGVFFHAADLPEDPVERDQVLLRLMGSPDTLQIDGLGGSRPITSKVAIISRSVHPDADIDYLFAQVDIERPLVGYQGNCGNISAGVGPFAYDEDLVDKGNEETAEVRIRNVNTNTFFRSRFPVRGGRAQSEGRFRIPGVPGTGARIELDYSGTVGATTGRLLPTGRPIDIVTLESGRSLEVSLVDVANCCVFVSASDFGLAGYELHDRLDGDPELLALVHEVRGKAAVLAGLATDWADAESQSPGLPMLCLVAPPADYRTADGEAVPAEAFDLLARLYFMSRLHETLAGTASICTAAASEIPGTTVAAAARGGGGDPTFRIGHPRGVMPVEVRVHGADAGLPQFAMLGVSRTARRLLTGVAHLPSPGGE